MRIKDTFGTALMRIRRPYHFSSFLTFALSCLVFASPYAVCASTPKIAADIGPHQEKAGMAEAVRVDRAPRMDGTLNDPLWQSAKSIADFRQREPYEGQSPTEKTEVRILYTRRAVYFGIHCFDSASSRITATELRRDVSQDLDDHFEILIDSNHDRRGAYVFRG